MNKLTEIYNQASDALLELQVEREHASTFNSIILNTVVYKTVPVITVPVITLPYESSVVAAVTDSMCNCFNRMDKAVHQLENLLSELKTIAKEANA